MVKTFTDQIGRQVEIKSPPRRIISLVPSITEFLFDLGLDHHIVGVTKFCVHPASARTKKAIVGGTKNFRFEEINNLKPDLIIGNKEENYEEGILKLAAHYPVWVSDITQLDDAYAMMRSIGTITGAGKAADEIVGQIVQSFQTDVAQAQKTVVYLIWNDPLMTAGPDTFIHNMLEQLGLENLIKENRYPVVTTDDIAALQPDYLFLSSEPFPFKEEHVNLYSKTFPGTKVMRVDGEIFSWYGSRMRQAMPYFRRLSVEMRG